MYIYIHVCIYIRIHVHMFTCKCIYNTHMCTCAYIHTYNLHAIYMQHLRAPQSHIIIGNCLSLAKNKAFFQNI